MALRVSKAHFQPRPNKRGDGWHILVTWNTGNSVQVPDFASEDEADDWIETKSADWLKARQTGSHD